MAREGGTGAGERERGEVGHLFRLPRAVRRQRRRHARGNEMSQRGFPLPRALVDAAVERHGQLRRLTALRRKLVVRCDVCPHPHAAPCEPAGVAPSNLVAAGEGQHRIRPDHYQLQRAYVRQRVQRVLPLAQLSQLWVGLRR